MKVGLTSREVVFEEWDPDEVGEGVSGENDEHDQQNLAPMQMSKSEIFRFDFRCFHCSKEGHRQKKRKDLNLYIDLIFLLQLFFFLDFLWLSISSKLLLIM